MKYTLLLLVTSILLIACSDDVARRSGAGTSSVGESCEYRNQCEVGLFCFVGKCTIGNFNVKPSAKSCDLIQCQSQSDCESFGANAICEMNRCVAGCTFNDECGFDGICLEGACVECRVDDDCQDSASCQGNHCVRKCATTGDCGDFQICMDTQCIDQGCMNDRECKADLGDARAICRLKDGEPNTCMIPCSKDVECNSVDDYNFFGCIDGACEYLGCQTDEECRQQLGTVGSGEDVVCR